MACSSGGEKTACSQGDVYLCFSFSSERMGVLSKFTGSFGSITSFLFLFSVFYYLGSKILPSSLPFNFLPLFILILYSIR